MDNRVNEVDEINLKALIDIPLKYKYLVISTIIISLLAAVAYIYFQPKVYKATATLEINVKKEAPTINDLLASAITEGSRNIVTEMEIIKSRFVAEMALKKVDFLNHYYYVDNFRKIEYYKDAPFKAEVKKGRNIKFTIYPKGDNKFELAVKKLPDGTKIDFHKTAEFGSWIKTPYFEIKITKTGELKHKKYLYILNDIKSIVDELRKRTSVKRAMPKASVIIISFEDNVAKRAQEYVNALAEAYLKQSIETKTKQASKRIEFIDKQLQEITKNLKESQNRLADFKKRSNIVNLSSKTKAVIERASKIEGQLAEISLKKEVMQALYNQVKSGYGIESISIVGMGNDAGSLLAMVQKLQDAVVKKKMLLQDYTNAHPEVVKVTNEIMQLKRSILRSIRTMLKLIKEKEAFLKHELKKENKLIASLPKNEKILSNLKRRFLVNEKIYSYLLEKRSESAIIKASTISSNRIIDRAIEPQKPIKPNKKLALGLGAGIGFLLGIVLAYFKSMISDKIESKEDIERLTTVPVVANIPHIKKGADNVVVLKETKSLVAESFRTLRTNLQFMMKNSDKIITVTSTIASEGKTTVAVNLAAIISIAGKRCVILNLDMRKPTLYKRFKLSNSKGVSTYLAGKSLLYEIIQKSLYENLDVITSGPIPPNPSELINSEEFKELIRRLKDIYDVIILDTPPIGLVSDARMVMNFSDINIYIVREGYSKKEFISGINKLKEEKVKNLCIVFNDVKEISSKGYGYGYYG